jgi:hypothetical protein
MRMKLVFMLILFASLFSFSQAIHRTVSIPYYVSMNAYTAQHTDLFSISSNKAALAQLDNSCAGVFSERRFLLSSLNHFVAVIGLHAGHGNFGMNTGYFGFKDYNETQIGLAYAKKLGSKLDIGACFNFNSIKISGYGNSSAINGEIGILLHLTDKLHAGINVFNPAGGKFGNDFNEKLATVITVGSGYEASENFFVSTEIKKEEGLPVNVNAGIQYKFLPQLFVRVSIASETSTTYFGIGFIMKSFRMDVIASYHPQLGFTPAMLLVFNFKSKQN